MIIYLILFIFSGSIWEAACKISDIPPYLITVQHKYTYFLAFASYYNLDNLLAIIDVNRLGQSQETQLKHDIQSYVNRFEAFGWHAIPLDGHDINALVKAYAEAKYIFIFYP